MTTTLDRPASRGAAVPAARPAVPASSRPRSASSAASPAAPLSASGRAPVVAPAQRRLSFAAMVLVLLGGGLCTLLALNTASAAAEVQERDLAAKSSTLSDAEQDLRRSVSALEAPAALAAAARAVGMVPGEHPAFLVIGPDGAVSVLGDPQPAPVPVAPAPDPEPATTPSPDPTTASITPTPAPEGPAAPVPDPVPTPAGAGEQTSPPAEAPAAPQ